MIHGVGGSVKEGGKKVKKSRRRGCGMARQVPVMEERARRSWMWERNLEE